VQIEVFEQADRPVVERLARLINDVYGTAERGLWRDGVARTTPDELAERIRDGQIVVAARDTQIVGTVAVWDVDREVSAFGMLAVPAEERGSGIGHALLDFIEAGARDRGARAMQLELMLPREWSHPSKEFLKGWYGRRGYRLVRTTMLDEAYPRLTPLLATPCDLQIHQKPL
jgi:N-acetylglutamate synthase-like GNAT family acetyltransferase